jgi:hypothetical protein
LIGARFCHLVWREKFALLNRAQSKESVQGKTRSGDAWQEVAIDGKYFFSLIDKLQTNTAKVESVKLCTSFTLVFFFVVKTYVEFLLP